MMKKKKKNTEKRCQKNALHTYKNEMCATKPRNNNNNNGQNSTICVCVVPWKQKRIEEKRDISKRKTANRIEWYACGRARAHFNAHMLILAFEIPFIFHICWAASYVLYLLQSNFGFSHRNTAEHTGPTEWGNRKSNTIANDLGTFCEKKRKK